MAMNRKAIVFSILSLIISIIIISSVLYKTSTQDSKASGLHAHILSANDFLTQLEIDLSRVIQITGYRGLIGLEEHISFTGQYLNNTQVAFIEVVTNGSVNGTTYDVMTDATLTVFEQRMQSIANGLGLQLDLTISNVTIGHVSPFKVRVNTTINVNLTTRDSSTTWNYSTVVANVFSIEELKDPLYTVGTNARVPTPVKESNVSRPYISATNDTSRLQEIFNNTLYIPDPDGPSFLMRFEGDFSANATHGIASLVDTKVLESQGLTIQTDRSNVDHIYFGNSSSSRNNIVNMPADFFLNDEHLALYDAVGKVT